MCHDEDNIGINDLSEIYKNLPFVVIYSGKTTNRKILNNSIFKLQIETDVLSYLINLVKNELLGFHKLLIKLHEKKEIQLDLDLFFYEKFYGFFK